MGIFRKLKRKIDAGLLEELDREVRWLWIYIRRYRMTVCIHILLGTLAIVMGLGTSVATKQLIDAVTGGRAGAIGPAAAMMAGMMVSNVALKMLAGRIGAAVNIRVQNEIQAEVYERVLTSDWESLESFRSGDLLRRLTEDVSIVSGGITGFVPSLISSCVQFVGALIIMLCYDPMMALIAMLGIPVSALLSRVLVGKMHGYNRRMKDMSDDMMSFYEDSVANLTSVKAFDITDLFCQKMSALQAGYRDEYIACTHFSLQTKALMSLVGLLVSSCCFAWGAYRLWTGVISFGVMTMFLQLSSSLSSAFASLMSLGTTAISVSTSVGRIMTLIKLPSEQVPREREFRSEDAVTLVLDQVCFTYSDGRGALKNACFTAGPGDLIAVTGPSGEGKTTILRILLGLLRPCSGSAELRCDGERHPLSAATRSAFAYVPQGNSMFAGTIGENLRLAMPEADDDMLAQALRAACAWEFVRELPGGLDYRIGSGGKGISEGQAQRLAVARALLRRAPILLLDEATSALDEETENRMLHNLMESGMVRTCIFVTHRPGTARFCTKQYFVREGEVEIWGGR